MPTIRDIGIPGPANDLIGGVPTVHYLDFDSKGRGEVVRMFCEDAGIAFKDWRWTFNECNGPESATIAKYNPCKSTPFVELDGKVLVQSIPIIRYWCHKLGKYEGKNEEERYFVDVVADIVSDWRTKFVDSLFIIDSKGFNLMDKEKLDPMYAHHRQFYLPKYLNGLEHHLTNSLVSQGGPYVLGSEVTYADFMLWQIYHDEREIGGKMDEILSTTAPRLKLLIDAVTERPNIMAYHNSDRYYN